MDEFDASRLAYSLVENRGPCLNSLDLLTRLLQARRGEEQLYETNGDHGLVKLPTAPNMSRN